MKTVDLAKSVRVYVALGDSSTEGIGDPIRDGRYRGWADRVADGLSRCNAELEYANLAVRGRLATDVELEQLPRALTLAPDFATVFAGVNDLLRRDYDAERTEASLFAIMSGLRDAGAAVLTITAADLSTINPVARLVRRRLLDLNERIRRVAAYTESSVIDIARMPVAADVRLWSEDRLHASAAGHERIAYEIISALGQGVAIADPLSELGPSSRQRPWGHVSWTARHLVPWVRRHHQGVSSGDDRGCKYPALTRWPLAPAWSSANAATSHQEECSG